MTAKSRLFGQAQKNALKTLIAMALIVFCVSPLQAKPSQAVNLADMKDWDIVLDWNAIPSEIYAAEEFQAFFSSAGGVKLPIVYKIDRWDRHVFIGPGQALSGSKTGFGVAGLGEEDLRIIIGDNNIAIAGGRPRGTLNGVYTFLEDYLGIRFLTADHTYVPAVGENRLAGPLDRVYRPPFAEKRLNGYKLTYGNPVFAVRSRCLTWYWEARFGGVSPFGHIGESFYRQVPFEVYGKGHPEYFGLWGGKRMNDFVNTHLCVTNPELLPIMTDAVLKEIESPDSVERKNFSVSQNDNLSQYCQCEKCAAVDGREESHMGALLEFVNEVADKVGTTHPDVFIGTLAYGFSRKPPKTVRPRDNVQICIAGIEACQIHSFDDPNCPNNVKYMQDLRGWSQICKHPYAWTYNVNFNDGLLPYPNLYAIKPNINALVNAGVKGVFMQCSDSSAAEMSDLRNYLLNRLLWNPALDDEAVINEFLDLHYGQAAPPIRQFIALIHKHYKDAGTHNSSNIEGQWDLPVDKDVAQAGLKLFVEALRLAENDEVKARVEKASICAYRAAINPIWKLQKGAFIDPALAAQMSPLVKEFFRLCDKYGLATGDRERIEGILSDPGSAKPTVKLPLLPISAEWRFTTDPKEQGEQNQYFKTDFNDSDWNVLKDYGFWPGDYNAVGWYRQAVNLPADIAGKKHLYLFFGAVDEDAFVYLNGKYAFERSVKSTGQTPQVLWEQPFLYDVKGLVKPGQPNLIAVKVYNSAMAGGIWQPVYLFPSDEEWTAQAIADNLQGIKK